MTFIEWAMFPLTLLAFCNISAAEGKIPEAVGLEDNKWQLVEINEASVSSLAGEKQPYILFDSAQKKVTGFAGCNNFFASYEINGTSLKFGPVGSTRMACPDLEMNLETEVFKVLDKTRSWDIRDGRLLLLDESNVLARFTNARGDDAAIALESMTVLSRWFPSGKVTLSLGEYRKRVTPNSASETVVKLSDKKAFGLINGKETGAVILVTDPGGSGTFYDLALLIKETAGWVNTDTVFLGDRVKVQSIEITGDTIVIKMKTHGPGDPMCCPSTAAVKQFAVTNNRLVPAADETPEKNIQGIKGTVWQWVRTLYNDDRKAVPGDPTRYTVQFREDGTLNVKADCNQKGGTYTYSPEEKRLSIEITHSTMAACPEDSLEEDFVRGLSAAAICFIENANLYIDMKFDSGTMQFSKQKKK